MPGRREKHCNNPPAGMVAVESPRSVRPELNDIVDTPIFIESAGASGINTSAPAKCCTKEAAHQQVERAIRRWPDGATPFVHLDVKALKTVFSVRRGQAVKVHAVNDVQFHPEARRVAGRSL